MLYLAPWLKEFRIGLLAQEDLSELSNGPLSTTSIHYDAGLQVSYRLNWPVWLFVFNSELELRYLVPDLDDRRSDLALRLHSINKIALPLDGGLSVFAFADVFVVSGKLESNRQFGASAVFGAGLSFNYLATFNPVLGF